ncbi:PREDICTED: snurportin-1 [Vollenhovia emeryi]|uniref:snurportin-1 n=1 Tax=Vollenhovia emeryi TaxID=411798 RepID=UPI0005F56D58|nr:PREDICTED: snurportin-1 [Vollenhovia emeryi]
MATTDIMSNNMSEDKSDNINESISDNTSDNVINTICDKTNSTISNCDEREAVRRQFYKKPVKRDNMKLEIDDSTPQEERRRVLLEYQKKQREETVNIARGIQIINDAEEYSAPEDEKYMGVDKVSWYFRVFRERTVSRMMLSEWMLEVPQDLIENWVMVPCPKGNRVRLISGWGETRAYSRKGELHSVFHSALPGGNPDSEFLHHTAALDGIWIRSRKLFYILDVLYWNQIMVTNCETEFRQYWIKSKFQETPELEERGTKKNKYPILILPNIDCNCDLSSALMNLDDLYPLDGLLFYHRKALYTFGTTPLVTWLKPFMLPEVLGIYVPSPLDEKPDDYINFDHHILKVNSKKNRNPTKSVTNSMEIEVIA